MHPLDRPVWNSLTTHHAALSTGGALARRFLRDVNLFASARDDTPEALAAFAELLLPGEHVYVLQVPDIVVPPGLQSVRSAPGVQMVATSRAVSQRGRGNPEKRQWRDAGEPADAPILTLTDRDAPEMLALAQLTEPGPFLARTHVMGSFIGIRSGGRLVAMAGERMRFPGYTEVSGVCTHPEFRGRGFARLLSASVAARIEARGETPFLHAWQTNHAAISLYEKLGFQLRAPVNVVMLARRQE